VKKIEQYRERIFAASITEIILLMLFMILAVATLYRSDRDKYGDAIEFIEKSSGQEILSDIDTLSIDSLNTSATLQKLKQKFEFSEDQEKLFDQMEELEDSLDAEESRSDSLQQQLLLMAILDSDSLLQEISDLKGKISQYEYEDMLGENPPICGLQNDPSKRLVDSQNTLIFNIYFSKTNKGKYILEFDPDQIHLNNPALINKTPNIQRQFFELKYSKTKRNSWGKGKGDYHLNFSDVHNFLSKVKDSRRINQNDPNCSNSKYMNKAHCLECYYNSQLWISDDVSKENLIEAQRIIRQYINLESDVRTY
tara:strand:+ start:416 stop:1345 length:930 start_codon:yes stop_codon:yes gene_type:complete